MSNLPLNPSPNNYCADWVCCKWPEWLGRIMGWVVQVLELYTLHARTRKNFCANFVPWAYINRPYLGRCGNSEEQSSYWNYYPCLFQSFPVYPLCMTVNHRVTGSSPAWGAIIEFPFRESLKRGFFVLRLVPFTSPILVKQTDWCYIFGSF